MYSILSIGNNNNSSEIYSHTIGDYSVQIQEYAIIEELLYVLMVNKHRWMDNLCDIDVLLRVLMVFILNVYILSNYERKMILWTTSDLI